MQRLLELIDKYHEYILAQKTEAEAKKQNETIRQADNKLFVEKSLVNDEIRAKKLEQARQIIKDLGEGRFFYEVETKLLERDGKSKAREISIAYITIMGLRFPVGAEWTDGRVVTFDEILASGKIGQLETLKQILAKFELDPVGAKFAVCEAVRIAMMKDRASLRSEIEYIESEIRKYKSELEMLEKLADEKLADNALLKQIFKKKYKLKEQAESKIEELKQEIRECELEKKHYTSRLIVAEGLVDKAAIEDFVDEELEFLRAFVSTDWDKKVSETSMDLQARVSQIEEQRQELAEKKINILPLEGNRARLDREFGAALKNMESLFDDKGFVEILRTFDTSGLSEEDVKIIELLRSEYQKYLAKFFAQYENN